MIRMDIASRRIPLVIIAVLLAILVVQYVANTPDTDRLIDPTTCEVYSQKGPGGGRVYLDEFDQKCLDLKNMLP